MTALPAKLTVQDYTATCNFLNRASIALLTVSYEHWLECPSNRDILNKRKNALFAKYHLLNLDKSKLMTVFNVVEKRLKSCVLPSGFCFEKSSLQKQKSPFTVKFSPCSSLEVTFFVLLCFLEI